MQTRKLKVCAYARVSTDNLRQEDSLENQTETYERIITANENMSLSEYMPIEEYLDTAKIE